MANCTACGKYIKRVYEWNGNPYGIECFKKIALPEIKRLRDEAEQKRLEEWNERCVVLVEVLKSILKSVKVRSEYKLDVYRSMINQFEEKGFLTKKQVDYAIHLFGQKEALKMWEIQYLLGMRLEIDYFTKKVEYGTKKERREAIQEMKEKGYTKNLYGDDIDEFAKAWDVTGV